MILHDVFALHRKWWDREWKPSFGDDQWTEWDFILAEVFQIVEDYTNKENGQWLPDDMSGDVYWEVKRKYSGADAELENARENQKLGKGESFYVIPIFDESKPKPTLTSMMEDLENERADGRPTEMADARPPTPDELAAMIGTGPDTIE